MSKTLPNKTYPTYFFYALAFIIPVLLIISFAVITSKKGAVTEQTEKSSIAKPDVLQPEHLPINIRPETIPLPILDKHYPGEPDHMECYNKACVIVWGKGENLCNQNTDCLNN